MTIIPDSSVPITTGTAPDLGPINPSVGQVQGNSVPATGLFPKPEYTPRVEGLKNYRPAEFGISEAVWGGMLQTAWAAAMMANDMPAFDVMPNYDAEAELIKTEQELRYRVQDDDREHLLRSRSPGEFMYRQFQLDEKARGLQAMAARPIAGMIGATADVDILLGYGIGATSRIAGASRAITMANLTAGTAAGTAGTYAYAGDRAPFNTADAAAHVAFSSSLAFLYGTGFKYNKPITNRPSSPMNRVADDFEMDAPIERNVIPAEPGTAPNTNPLAGITPVDVAPIESAVIPAKPATPTAPAVPKPKKKRKSKVASKKVTSKPEEATDEDLLDAIDDFNDDAFKDLD